MSDWEDLEALQGSCPPGTRLVGPVQADGSVLSVNGQVTAACVRADGTHHGPSMSWHENGRRSQAGQYRDGLKEGEWTFWSETGSLISRGSFRAGKADGRWTTWRASGELESVAMYEDGHLIEKT